MVAAASAGAGELADRPGVVQAEFVFQKAPFAQCHASTLAESGKHLLAAWFGGSREGHKDVGIWLARRGKEGWSAPVEVANGLQAGGKRLPCWNPVLYQTPGPLLLYYKVGPSPSAWWGMVTMSRDGGRTWSTPRRLADGFLGPIKNKPISVGEKILCGSSTENAGWRVHFEMFWDRGRKRRRIGPVHSGRQFGAIQPTLLTYKDGRIQALCRSRQGRIVEVWSTDGGETWSKMAATALPNPNAGIDGVTLRDGRHLLVYNHTARSGPSPRGREMLNVAVSKDGKTWQAALLLETGRGEYSYPAVIQTADGRVHVTYTWRRRRIRHVVLDPTKLTLRDMPQARWPD